METVDIVGTVGAVASVASFAPQAWKIIRARNTDGLSLGMYALTVLAFSSWTIFGILKGEPALIIPNSICLAFSAFILFMIALPRGKTEKVAEKIDPVD